MTTQKIVKRRIFEVQTRTKKGALEATDTGALSEQLCMTFGLDLKLARALANLAWETRLGTMTDCTVRHTGNLIVEELGEAASPKTRGQGTRAKKRGSEKAQSDTPVLSSGSDENTPALEGVNEGGKLESGRLLG